MTENNIPQPSNQNPQYATTSAPQPGTQVTPQKTSTGKKVAFGCLGCGGLVIILIVVLSIFAVMAGKNTSNETTSSGSQTQSAVNTENSEKPSGNPTPTTQATAEQPKVEAPIKISAIDLVSRYKKNELAADKEFRGKQLEVTGKVKDVSEVLGVRYVSLVGETGDFALNGVSCNIDDSQLDKAASLEKGQAITVVGVGNGYNQIDVEIDECVIK